MPTQTPIMPETLKTNPVKAMHVCPRKAEILLQLRSIPVPSSIVDLKQV
jgi:hypothetical protein